MNDAIYRMRTEREIEGELLAARQHYDAVLEIACEFRNCESPSIWVVDGEVRVNHSPLPDNLQTELTRAAAEVARLRHELYTR